MGVGGFGLGFSGLVLRAYLRLGFKSFGMRVSCFGFVRKHRIQISLLLPLILVLIFTIIAGNAVRTIMGPSS